MGNPTTCLSWIVRALRRQGIVLVFYVDGPRGACKETQSLKGKTWLARNKDQVRFFEEVEQGMRLLNIFPINESNVLLV